MRRLLGYIPGASSLEVGTSAKRRARLIADSRLDHLQRNSTDYLPPLTSALLTKVSTVGSRRDENARQSVAVRASVVAHKSSKVAPTDEVLQSSHRVAEVANGSADKGVRAQPVVQPGEAAPGAGEL